MALPMDVHPLTVPMAAALFLAGGLAGGLNAVAGGGGFITLPILMVTGLPGVTANITGSMAVWPGSLAGLYAYRRELKTGHHPIALYLGIAAAGGLGGALLLLHSSHRFFLALLPYLLLLATVLFACGERLTRSILARTGSAQVGRAWVVLLMSIIAVYGGYFGGGMGIMTLAVLALLGMHDMHEMNALKTLLVATINGVGNLVFVMVGTLAWPRCLVMMAGCIIGGYAVSRIARTVDRGTVRTVVIAIGASMTAYFFIALLLSRHATVATPAAVPAAGSGLPAPADHGPAAVGAVSP
jgi:uncharacterized membrane protein YfcA